MKNVSVSISASELSYQTLSALIEKEILLIRVKNFCAQNICNELSTKFLNYGKFNRYLVGQDVAVQKIGLTLFETENKSNLLERYLDEALETTEKIRKICHPFLSPLDYFRLRLEEIWPIGAEIGKLDNRKMLPGIVRMFEKGASEGLPPHQDTIVRDIPGKKINSPVKTQLACNIYLQTPDKGGELEIWDFSPSQEEYKELWTGHHDFIDRTKIPPSAALIRPEPGELILFRSDCVHCVHPSKNASRVAMSCFIGYSGKDKALSYWA